MSYSSYNNIQIIGMMAAVPSTVVKVESFIPIFGEDSVRKFSTMTGVHSFRRTKHGQTASDLGYAAADCLLNHLNIKRESVGILVFASLSPDYLRPATACVLHKRLGLSRDCAAFDVGQGCSGFVYGLQVASAMLNCSDAEYALLIAAETVAKLPYKKDKSCVMLLGDAGTATVIRKRDGFSLKVSLATDGAHYSSAIVPAGGFRNPDVSHYPFISCDGIERTHYHYMMNGLDIFSFAVNDIPNAIKEFFSRTQTTPEDFDCFMLHQANELIIRQLCKKMRFPLNKTPLSLERYGNTSAAAIPLGLCDFYGETDVGTVSVLMCGFGTGLSLGIAAAPMDTGSIFPVIETDEIFTEAIIHDEEE